jgi:uncharacterized protein (DUF1501 family)
VLPSRSLEDATVLDAAERAARLADLLGRLDALSADVWALTSDTESAASGLDPEAFRAALAAANTRSAFQLHQLDQLQAELAELLSNAGSD